MSPDSLPALLLLLLALLPLALPDLSLSLALPFLSSFRNRKKKQLQVQQSKELQVFFSFSPEFSSFSLSYLHIDTKKFLVTVHTMCDQQRISPF